MDSTKKQALIAVLVAQGIVLHLLESMFPIPLPIPGVKLGLANIVTLLALVLFDFKTAFLIALLRTVLGSLVTGTLFSIAFFMSFAGAVASVSIMGLFILLSGWISRDSEAGLLSTSISGAVAHNLGQLAMAALLIQHAGIFYYLPVMLLASVPTGILTGILLRELLKYLRLSGRLDEITS